MIFLKKVSHLLNIYAISFYVDFFKSVPEKNTQKNKLYSML